MVIDFLCNQVFDGWEPSDPRLGGTEESIVQWAKHLKSLGHTVRVYRNGRLKHSPDGYFERYNYDGSGDFTINIKSSDIAPKGPTLYLTNETNATDLDLSAYDGVIWPSSWAARNIPVNNANLYVIPHGYDPQTIFPGLKVPKQCFYASSPDRGLETLLKVWPDVYAQHPEATLLVTYAAPSEVVPGVMFLGECTEDEMNHIYQTSDIWCHPCSGGELFCITGIKAQVAGCVPVVMPTMALAETVRGGYFAKTEQAYKEVLIKALSDRETNADIRKGLADQHYADWAETAELLLRTMGEVLNYKQIVDVPNTEK